MVLRCRPLSLALTPVLLLVASGVAFADDDPPPPPVYAPGPPVYVPGPPGPPIYVAPLSQQTQTTYVPQSVALSGPRELEAGDDSRPPPAGYTEVHRKHKGLIIGGAVTLGVTYSISAMVAAIGDDTGDGDNEVEAMWIPVLGPFLQIRETESSTGDFFLAHMGAAQLAGAIMLVYGMSNDKRVFVRNDLVSELSIGPLAAKGASGVALSGRFW